MSGIGYIRMGVAYIRKMEAVTWTTWTVRNILGFCCLAEELGAAPERLPELLGEYLQEVEAGNACAPIHELGDLCAFVDFIEWAQRELADPKEN